jgi:hypothetical protein
MLERPKEAPKGSAYWKRRFVITKLRHSNAIKASRFSYDEAHGSHHRFGSY